MSTSAAPAPGTTLAPGSGLTTTKAPFIEEARAHGDIYIHQPYELYSAENHATWGRLIGRMHDRWQRYANPRYLEGLGRLRFSPDAIPRLEDVNRFMQPLTGFRARARCVAGALKVTLARADGRPIAPGDRLELVTSDYLASGGDALMPELSKRAVIDGEHLVREALVAGLGGPKAASGVREARYDPAHPRLDFPGQRPVRCAAP